MAQISDEDEIIGQVNRKIDVFCAAVGAGGMLTGVSTELKKADASTKIIALEPASSASLSRGEGKAPYRFPRLFSTIWTRLIGAAHRIFHRMIWRRLALSIANLDQKVEIQLIDFVQI
jgi:cysteine synthase